MMIDLMSAISLWAIPVFISLIIVSGIVKKVPLYESFIEGAKDGFQTAISIIPHLVGMMVAVEVFRTSGALDLMIGWLAPVLDKFNVPKEVVPLALLRPITGSGSSAVMNDIFMQYGPDSFVGRLASVMQGSTDTTLYVITVYFGAVGIRNYRYALKVGLLADLVGMIASILIVNLLFE